MIYVASSWRNPIFESVVDTLRGAGYTVYDFKRDEGAHFHWIEAGVTSHGCSLAEYTAGLNHYRALQGFASDFTHMSQADTFVLVLPCGRSAHLELGWAVGQRKATAILFDDPNWVLPELMYAMVDKLAASMDDVLAWLPTVGERPDAQSVEYHAAR